MSNTSLAAKNYSLIDLHLHLDGSLPLHTVRELASMQGVSLPESDRELMARLQVDEDCKDLNEYLEKFFFVVSLLQRKDAITTAAYQLAEELGQQGLLYAEIRFAPQLHTEKGLSQREVVEAAIEGIRKSDFHANLILCCLRNDCNRKENLETVHLAKTYLGKGVCAADLAGAEALFPTADFAEEFTLANALGVPLTIHAGEAAGPESVVDALAFHPMRIGHGVRSMEDGVLVDRLAREGVPLELCPTSNLNTHIFGCMGEYPLRQFLSAGVRVTVNTDNMTVSGVTLESEYQRLMDTFSLTASELETLVRNAAAASFAGPEEKAWLDAQLDKRFPNSAEYAGQGTEKEKEKQ